MDVTNTITEHFVYVALADLRPYDSEFPRDISQTVAVFPKPDQRARARASLERLFHTFEDAPIIPLFELPADANRRAQKFVRRKMTEDPSILKVNLVGNLYRELGQFQREVGYNGIMPRVDGRAFLVFAKLSSPARTMKDREATEKKKEEKEANERKKEDKEAADKKKEEKEKARGRANKEKGGQRRERSGSSRGAGKRGGSSRNADRRPLE
jgi:hypothetical protein